eukprot:10866327-Karenia_brevis.AAC.1
MGVILNGLFCLDFDYGFTRMPQSSKDCPGVLDYVCASPNSLTDLQQHAFKILDQEADLSDHSPLSLEIQILASEIQN